MLGAEPSSVDVARAARGVVVSALRVGPDDGVLVITDGALCSLGEAVARAAEAVASRVELVSLDTLGRRPLGALPDKLVRRVARSHATVFIASAPHAELRMRQHLLHLVAEHGVRHAHMPGISVHAFAHGMLADYGHIARIGRRLMGRLVTCDTVTATSIAGTALVARLDRPARWFPQLGELAPGRWGNLPAGALYATPVSVDGVYVADACLGEFFGRREGLLTRKPVRFTIEESRVVKVDAGSAELANDVQSTLAFGPGSDRIGLVCIGVNVGMTEPTGDAIVDQNLPGLHLAIGDPAAKVTGATWSARTSFAACATRITVKGRDRTLIDDGVVLLD